MKQYIRYFAIFYLALTMASTASADTGFSDQGTFEVDGLTFVPSIRGLPWCRPDTTFAYKGARELVDEGSVSKLFPMFEVFGKELRKACPEARSIAYTTISTFGQPLTGPSKLMMGTVSVPPWLWYLYVLRLSA